MSSSNPLSYEGTKAVLQYMGPQSRFRISLHCPTLRNTEKIVPLKIYSLHMGNNYSIHINDKKYELGVIRKYPKFYIVPRFHQYQNDTGGVPENLDEYGIPKHYTEEQIDLEIQLKKYSLHRCAMYPMGESSEWSVEKYQTELQELTNKRKKVLPPYTLQLQLTAKGVEEQYKYTNSFDLQSAHRQLIKFFFSRRREPILVKNWNLRIDISNVFEEHVKFLVRNLKIDERVVSLDHVSQMIQSFPLNSMTTDRDVSDLNHPLEKFAKTLKTKFRFSEESLSIYSKLPNENVILDSCNDNSVESHVQLFRAVVEHWQEVSHKIGATFTIKIEYLEVLDQFRAEIKSLDGKKKNENNFCIPLNYRSKIHVKLTPRNQYKSTYDRFGFLNDAPDRFGFLKLSVVAL